MNYQVPQRFKRIKHGRTNWRVKLLVTRLTELERGFHCKLELVSLRIGWTGRLAEALYVWKNVRDWLQLVCAHSHVSSELEHAEQKERKADQ